LFYQGLSFLVEKIVNPFSNPDPFFVKVGVGNFGFLGMETGDNDRSGQTQTISGVLYLDDGSLLLLKIFFVEMQILEFGPAAPVRIFHMKEIQFHGPVC
jgi:hypothetical protein